MRDYKIETEKRVEFIKKVLSDAKADGIVYGNSGGKDSVLVGALCKIACENTVGIIMPCGSKSNYESDKTDAELVAKQYNIPVRIVDLSATRDEIVNAIGSAATVSDGALVNIPPRLRMTTLYAIAFSENRIVAGTGNKSEAHMGYFTKWGDGAYDFNPIADLTVTEVYEFLTYLDAPESIIKKAPSAGLYNGQTDEKDMGVTYASIDRYLTTGEATDADRKIIDRYHNTTHHKRNPALKYEG